MNKLTAQIRKYFPSKFRQTVLSSILGVINLLLSITSFCQNSYQDKYSASLKNYLSSTNQDKRFLSKKNNQTYLAVFLEMASSSSLPVLQKTSIRFRTVTGTIATADIPINDLPNIAALQEVKRIELPLLFRKTDTVMRKMITADKVLNGTTPLDRAYSGKNVVIGIIDDGIDVTHPDFLDSNGKTRLKAYWNMDRDGTPPTGYQYGHLLTPDTLNYFIAQNAISRMNPYYMQSLLGYCYHGSSVAGLAAGNSGVAPGADIVAVALTAFADTLLRSDRIIDGIAFIYDEAKAEGKKCVINISLGVMDGAPHDGKSMIERAIDNFCYEKPDILICTSAGNNGNTWKHWGGFPINKDSSFAFFRCSYKASMYFSIPKVYSSTLRISVGEAKLGDLNHPNITRDSVFYQTPFLTISDLIQNGLPVIYTSYLKNGYLSSYIIFTAAHYNDTYDELILTTDEHTSGNYGNPVFDDHLYRFIFKGTGYVHAWFPFFNLHPIYYFDQNPYPNDSTYHVTDNDYTTVIPTHAFTVLSSGAYNIRNCFVNAQQQVESSYSPCQLTYFTSHGPTQDGRIKPDIISPGENVLAPRSATQDFFGYGDEQDSSWHYFAGTSASSPITAGVVALIWEKYPDLIRDSIIKLIKSTAHSDSFSTLTGPIPNNLAGWGKIDAFKAMTGVTTDIQSLCKQWTQCEAPPPPPPPPPQPGYTTSVRIYPNPTYYGKINIHYTSSSTLDVAVFNSVGQLVKVDHLPATYYQSYKEMDVSSLSQGLYFVRISGGGYVFKDRVLIMR
jgi:subtilisin family serine protease